MTLCALLCYFTMMQGKNDLASSLAQNPRLYIPVPRLKHGQNELIIFELHGAQSLAVEFLDKPDPGSNSSGVCSHTRGKIRSGENAGVACDTCRSPERDLPFVSEPGPNASRFSISSSQVPPIGRGQRNHPLPARDRGRYPHRSGTSQGVKAK